MFTLTNLTRKLFLFCLLATLPLASQALDKQYGITFVDYTYDGYATAKADKELERIAATGVGWTNILANQIMDNIDSTTIYRSSRRGETPSDEALIHAIKKAKSLGLKVMLYPHLDLANDPDHWFGEVGKNFDAAKWDKWFISYTKFLSHYADIAEQNGVEQISIGMELMYSEKKEAHWRKLIKTLRERYNGTLVYAENYDTETHDTTTSNVRWWDALDYIGIDAYYDLIPESNTNPSLEDMLEAWKPIIERLERYSNEWNRPILIPELGYKSATGSTHHPWNYDPSNSVNLKEQENAYKAFYQSFANKPWFAGIFWWSHSAQSEPSSSSNTRYSPIGKPAEEIIKQYLVSEPNPTDPPTDPTDPNAEPPVCDTGLDPKTIKLGEGTALWWWSENGRSAKIDNGIGSITLPSQYKWIHPTKTTTYTLTLKGEDGSTITCKTKVTVKKPLCELGTDPQIINRGQGTALWWWTENATSAKIDNNIGQAALPSNYKWFYPTETATYTMKAKNSNETSATCKTTITVR